MQAQKVGVYISKYSTNENQQSNKASSQAFGMQTTHFIAENVDLSGDDLKLLEKQIADWGKGMGARLKRIFDTRYEFRDKQLSSNFEQLNELGTLDVYVKRFSGRPEYDIVVMDKNNPNISGNGGSVDYKSSSNLGFTTILELVNTAFENCGIKIIQNNIKPNI